MEIFGYVKRREFLPLSGFKLVGAYAFITLFTFVLTFFVLPLGAFKLHFFQAGIFLAAFLFGPWAGAAAGALASSYVGLFVQHNPWIIVGNAILGLAAGYFYMKKDAVRAVLAAYGIQLPYLLATDYFLAGMPLAFLSGLVFLLLAENAASALIASSLRAPLFRALKQ